MAKTHYKPLGKENSSDKYCVIFQDFSRIFPKKLTNPRTFQDTFQIPGLSGTCGNHGIWFFSWPVLFYTLLKYRIRTCMVEALAIETSIHHLKFHFLQFHYFIFWSTVYQFRLWHFYDETCFIFKILFWAFWVTLHFT